MYDIRGMVEQLKLCDVEFEKNKFHCFKKAISIGIYRKSIAIRDFGYSKNKEADVKYFIRYKTGKKVRPLPITLPQGLNTSIKLKN